MQTDWADWLAPAEFAYNNRTHSSTKESPFFLEYGRHPRVPTTPDSPAKIDNPSATEFHETLSKARQAAGYALNRAAESMKKFADRKRKEAPSYQVGQLVWLNARHIKPGRPSKKLDVRRTGPFEILAPVPADATTPSAFRLRLPPSWKIHPVVHVSLLRPAHIDTTLHPPVDDDNLRPPPDIVDEKEEYEVEKILDHKGGVRRRRYLVKWKGYPLSEATWEPKKFLAHSRDAVLQYEASLKA